MEHEEITTFVGRVPRKDIWRIIEILDSHKGTYFNSDLESLFKYEGNYGDVEVSHGYIKITIRSKDYEDIRRIYINDKIQSEISESFNGS